MTVIIRPERVPVILPLPPKGMGFPPMPSNVSTAIRFAVSAKKEFVAGLMAETSVMELPHAQQLVAVWQIANPQRWAEYDCRVVFVSPEMLDAMIKTRARVTGGGLRAEDVLYRYPSFMLWWPSNAWVDHGNGIKVTHSIVSCYESGEHPVAHFGDGVATKERDTGRVGKSISMRWPGDARGLCLSHFWDNGEVSSGSICMEGDLRRHFEQFASTKLPAPDGITSNTEESWAVTTRIAEVIVNLLLLMSSHPQYVQPVTVAHRVPGERKVRKGVRAYVVARPMQVTKRLPDTRSPARPGQGGGGGQRRPHEREGHWRRQPHGDRFEIEHPDVGVITLDDSRRAHMVWIEPMWIDASLDRTGGAA